jgi:hypothetical protein
MIRAGIYVAAETLAALILFVTVRTDGAHTVATLLALIAVTLLALAQKETPAPQRPREEVDSRDGARDDITALSWSFMSRDNTVSVRAVHAFHQAASVRLGLHGIDLSDPEQSDAARALLGVEAYDLATESNPKPTMAQLARSIDALAAISRASQQYSPEPTRQTRNSR